jgi:hypothetical protein
VRTFRSGEPQLVLDVGPWLRSGENVLELLPQGDASGGALSVHVGKGSPAAGVLRLEAPEFTYTRRGNEPAVPSRASLIVR